VVGMASSRVRKASSVLWNRAMASSERSPSLSLISIVVEGGGALGKVPQIGLVLLVDIGRSGRRDGRRLV
jgi:hypothetical protein